MEPGRRSKWAKRRLCNKNHRMTSHKQFLTGTKMVRQEQRHSYRVPGVHVHATKPHGRSPDVCRWTRVTTSVRLRDVLSWEGGGRREDRSEGKEEMSVWSGQRAPTLGRRGVRRGGEGVFTEEAPSGWRSPPLPRLSAQTRTAPAEGKKVGHSRGRGEKRI